MIAKFSGGADHFENFLVAVRSRKVSDLTADILEGHLSSALCHLGNISYRLGTPLSVEAAKKHVQEIRCHDRVLETFERTLKHLQDNQVDIANLQITVGPQLAFNPETERFVENRQADALLTREYRPPFVVPEENQV
jgi:hypothetical protein